MLLQEALKSRVGQRLFLRFLLAGLLPILGLTLYTHYALTDLSNRQIDELIQQESKALALTFIDRLNWQTQIFQELIAADGISGTFNPLGLFKETSQAREGRKSELSNEVRAHLEQGLAALEFSEQSLRLLTFAPGTDRLMVATLNSAQLWENDLAPEAFCVFTPQGMEVYCSEALAGKEITKTLARVASRGERTSPKNTISVSSYRVGFWGRSLKANFASEGFVVAVARGEETISNPVATFGVSFAALSLLILGIVSWLAVRQIRHQLAPLDALLQGTRHVARGDFSSPIASDRNDEFGELSLAFDRMSIALRYKFSLQEALSRLDRAILSGASMEQMAVMVLDEALTTLPAVSSDYPPRLFYRNEANECRLQIHDGSHPVAIPPAGCPCDSRCLRAHGRRSTDLEPDRDMAIELARKADDPSNQAHVQAFSAFSGEDCTALLLIGFDDAGNLLEDLTHSARNLVDRLSIAHARLRTERALQHQSTHDALTGLPNRSLLDQRIAEAMRRSDEQGTSVAVIIADLDNFKQINDSLGHGTGDLVLIECASRMREILAPTTTLARFGGDEFVFVIPDLPDHDLAAQQVDVLCEKLSAALARPIEVEGITLHTNASLGIALYPANARSEEVLLQRADAAMYDIKATRGGGHRFFTETMNDYIQESFDLSQELKEAIENGEMRLHYQPQVGARDGRIQSAEALVRWQSPTRGLVSPGIFIPELASMGLMNQLGEWVLTRACEQMAEWDRQGQEPMRISINMSPRQFLDPDFSKKVQAALEGSDLAPERLEIELLEETTVDDSSVVAENLVHLQEIGVQLALDDFGTGYSSLVHLTRLPASTLKLDRAFIKTMIEDPRQRELIKQIISLAAILGLTVVAEGVEEEEQRAELAAMNCDLIQGFLFSPALPADAFVEWWLKNSATDQKATL